MKEKDQQVVGEITTALQFLANKAAAFAALVNRFKAEIVSLENEKASLERRVNEAQAKLMRFEQDFKTQLGHSRGLAENSTAMVRQALDERHKKLLERERAVELAQRKVAEEQRRLDGLLVAAEAGR